MRHNVTYRWKKAILVATLAALVLLVLAASSAAVGGAGSTYSWGDNFYFQLGDGAEQYTINPTPPTGLPGAVSKIAVYGGGTLALTGGTWHGWGYGLNAELCNGASNSEDTPVATSYPGTATKLSGGGFHVLALTPGGAVQGCGDNGVGQLGDGTTTNQSSPVPVSGLSSGVVAIGTGEAHSLAAMSDGSVRSWGYNYSGQLGDGTTANRSAPVAVSGLTDVTAVTGGYMHSLALKSDGTVMGWGWNAHGEVGDGTNVQRNTPVPVLGLTNVTAIAAGVFWSMALKGDGTVWTWGGDFAGALGTGTGTDAMTPQQIPGLTGVVAIAAGSYHGVALKSDGTVVTWGQNSQRQLGNSTTAQPGPPSTISGLTGVVAIGAGRDHTSALRGDGTVVSWGGNVSGSAAATHVSSKSTPAAVIAPGDSGLVQVAGGYGHALALTSEGDVLAWGSNNYGQLGDGGTSTSATPKQVAGLGSGVRQVATSLYYASYALKADGSVAGWGSNDNGELGDGTHTSRTSPVSVTGLGGPAISIAAGGFHGLAAMNDGTVRAWGHNVFGNLGNGTTTDTTSAVTVSGLSNVTSVSAGEWSSYAVTGTGALYAWGRNDYGQLGDGTTTDRPTPTLVPGLANVTAVAGGYNFAIALRSDGTVWSWGSNWDGTLGDNSTVQRSTPGQVPGLSDVVAIAARGLHVLALTSDGSVFAWGYNGVGQIGNGTTSDVLAPTPVTLPDTAQTIGTGFYSSYAILGPLGPVDGDGDGIDDAIDTGNGTFQDGGTTSGSIGPIPAGYTVTVTDLPDPDGIRFVVSGTGTQKVTFTLTNPVSGAPCGTLKLGPGSDIEATCGSITVHVVAGSAEIALSDDTSLIVDTGETARVVISTAGTFVVQSVTGGDGKVSLTTSGGGSTPVGASSNPVNLWDFVGFSQPVDNGGVYNVAKAGSNIPLKWRLLSESGAPITNLASASVSVSAIGCQGGGPSDQVEEVAPSASGLQNLGNGYYQLNWKTDKSWTGCKQMRLSLAGEGPITHNALFTFK
jgi:alpha-tubulin suppressor-like RCC1 family protein